MDAMKWYVATVALGGLLVGTSCGERSDAVVDAGTARRCEVPAPPRGGAPVELVHGQPIPLRDGFFLGGPELGVPLHFASTACLDTSGWRAVTVPTTVSAVDARDLSIDPYQGFGLRELPGHQRGFEAFNSDEFPLLPTSPFVRPWTYVRRFDLPDTLGDTRLVLRLDGINYRASIWLNGEQLAGPDAVVGTYRRFSLDVTERVVPGATNTLAIEVTGPEVASLTHTFVDWMPLPPDRHLGLWRDVWLVPTGPVAIEGLHVASELSPARDRADLTVRAELINRADRPVTARLSGRVGEASFEHEVTLTAREARAVELTPAQVAALRIERPALWWPRPLGEPVLHTASLEVAVGGVRSDRAERRFGIRRVASRLTERGHFQLLINDRPVLVRGAGWAPDLLLRPDRDRERDEVELVKALGINAVRFEGWLATDSLLDRLDEAGIMTLAGWPCCSHWERWSSWTPEDREVAVASTGDELARLRGHAGFVLWLNSSDELPPPEVERAYLDALAQSGAQVAVLSSAGDSASTVTGPSGVKMNGPYDYVPPVYWYADTEIGGGAFGFATEVGTGPAIPIAASVRRMLGADAWPVGPAWIFHTGQGPFRNLDALTEAMEGRFGPAPDLDRYALRAQLLGFDSQRAMFEAYRAREGIATGVVQWMLNSGWPSLNWHSYDWYLVGGGTYHGARTANRTTHLQYSYDTREVVLTHAGADAVEGLEATATVHDLRYRELARITRAVTAMPSAPVVVGRLEWEADLAFVMLELRDRTGDLLERTTYVVPAALDEVNYAGDHFPGPDTTRHASFAALDELPEATVEVEVEATADGARVRLRNVGSELAFFIQVRATDAADRDVPAAALTENFVSVPPNQDLTIGVRTTTERRETLRFIEVAGWNMLARRLDVPPPP